MPGNVQNAAPSTVLPQTLCRAFVHSLEYPIIENEYRNGESQRSVLTDRSRRFWRLAKRLTPTQLAELRNFYDARKGTTEPFYFYDPWETVPKFSWDSTGQAVVGRHLVRLEGEWSHAVGLGRSDVQIGLIELA